MVVRVCTVWCRFAWSDVCRPELGCSHRKVGHGSTGTQRYRLLLICLLPGPMCTARARTFLAERWDRGSTGAQRRLLLRPLCSLAPHLCVVRAISAKYTQRGSHHISFASAPLLPASIYIYTYYIRRYAYQKCIPKMLSKSA